MILDKEETFQAVIGVGYRLRELGKRVSTADLVKAVELAESYRALVGSLTRAELAYILWSTFTTVQVRLEDLEELVAKELAGRGVRERAERIAREIRAEIEKIGMRPGDRISKKKIAMKSTKRDRRTALASYTKLRNIGAIRGKPGRERILSLQELEKLAWKIAVNGYSSLDEASRDLQKTGWDDLMIAVEARMRPHQKQLSDMSERNLIKLAEAAKKKHDRITRELVAEELVRRINSGFKIHSPDKVADILEETGLLTPLIRRKLASTSRISTDKLKATDIIDMVRSMGIESGGELVAKGINSLDVKEAKILIKNINPRLLWGLGKNSRKKLGNDPLLDAAVEAARSVREALKYAETGDEARADMARYYADRAAEKLSRITPTRESTLVNYPGIIEMIKEANAIVNLIASIEGPARPQLIDEALKGLDYPAKIRLLKSVYKRANTEWNRIILHSAERLLSRLSAREGLRLLREYYLGATPPGRIDVRRSIYSNIRQSPRPIVYMKRRRTSKVSLALDSSGSMMDYATWAIAVASLFPRHLQRLVIFSHTIRVYEGPFTKREFVQALFNAEFSGYTNISKALEEASIPGVKKIVAITDLRQTVRYKPLEEVVNHLIKTGKRIVFIVPGSHDEYVRVRVEEKGARVLLAHTPRKAAQHLLRALLRS